ncbi:class A beta-lactamase, subclass A2 [Apibacter muscae]|uniref:class A beta-lactamase, subclass A2 n=1 Tax=Apibacter muscae TaxID=2509004 RepID=UPI0011AD302C|nr:class A beta-lactamase, subclass A2 [Apibacter muscae]TWP29991.1 class A beta-lactamase, subclass A2 [Apibacter muscae]
MKKFITLLFLLSINLFFSQKILIDSIQNVIKDKQATVGVGVIYHNNDTLSINNQYLYPTMSVYKFHQALAILNYLEKNKLSLNTSYFIKKEDLDPNTYSPLFKERPEGNFNISIKDLLYYSLCLSDNNVSNYLFNYLVSPVQTEDYIKSLGTDEISIKGTEKEMSQNHDNQYLNWTRPLATAILFNKILNKKIFKDEYQDFLIETLIKTNTGENKIKGLLPKDLIVGHKTGNSYRDNGIKVADNDAGFVLLPNGKKYTLAIFIMNSKETDEVNASMIAKISRLIYNYYSKL